MIYASLTGPLIGVFVPIAVDTKDEARSVLMRSKLARLWCAMYTKAEAEASVKKYGGFLQSEMNALLPEEG